MYFSIFGAEAKHINQSLDRRAQCFSKMHHLRSVIVIKSSAVNRNGELKSGIHCCTIVYCNGIFILLLLHICFQIVCCQMLNTFPQKVLFYSKKRQIAVHKMQRSGLDTDCYYYYDIWLRQTHNIKSLWRNFLFFILLQFTVKSRYLSRNIY